jgi:hypothetical protein
LGAAPVSSKIDRSLITYKLHAAVSESTMNNIKSRVAIAKVKKWQRKMSEYELCTRKYAGKIGELGNINAYRHLFLTYFYVWSDLTWIKTEGKY